MKSTLNGMRDTDAGSIGIGRAEQLLEVSVFFFLIVPSMVLSFFAVKQGSRRITALPSRNIESLASPVKAAKVDKQKSI